MIKDYQDMGLLVEGPLANLRKSEMHLSKPSKLINKFNPVREGERGREGGRGREEGGERERVREGESEGEREGGRERE